ncbi:SAM-dependent methyltransferase [Geminicoccus flavidas]|uniref:SAM-dependent methyltransferase n=1 Tax=Geminicoccus flavidas TaxID=2506407 RepID=UPI0013586085|nr:cyclopropane-fatty-acyl-phospholipid synthase family protein [Geminicoccus flavidas]
MLFPAILHSVVRVGSLHLIDGSGRTHEYGDGSLPRCTVRLGARHLDYTLALNPELSIGEAYMDGLLTIEEGTLLDLLEIAATNYSDKPAWFSLWSHTMRRLRQSNPVGRARRNVAHHYDLSDELYTLFLDEDRQYSCAYFINGTENLNAAQENKKRHIATKLLLGQKDLKILDIGSGWGGLGLYLAEEADAEVTGITLSVEQHKMAQMRAAAAGLDNRVQFHLRDYREQTGMFDRVVSVGMFEHVGRKNYSEFFKTVDRLLDANGVALLHSIGRSETPSPINPFISKYIFPGADLPSLSEVFAALGQTDLIVTDVEILLLHYAETLRHWRNRVVANRQNIVKLYDERFFRMWEFYLALCEVGFRCGSMMVFQMQLAKRSDAVPVTRDYITDRERQVRALKQHMSTRYPPIGLF